MSVHLQQSHIPPFSYCNLYIPTMENTRPLEPNLNVQNDGLVLWAGLQNSDFIHMKRAAEHLSSKT